MQLEGGSPLLAGRERELRWLRRRWAQAREGRVVCVMVWGPAGIGKTRLVAELAAEVQHEGAAVLYAGGGEVAEAALATVAEAGTGHRPTLLVFDYADDAPPSVLEAAAALARAPEGRPLMVCVLHHDEQGPPAFAALLESGVAQRLRLDPLSEDATAEIAALYAPAEGVVIPMPTLLAESEGVPLRIHRAASGWAQAQVAERLGRDGRPGRRRSTRLTQEPGEGSGRRRRPAVDTGAQAPLRSSRSRPIPRRPRCAPSAAWPRSTPLTPSTSSAASAWSPSSSPAWSARPCSRSSAPRAAASPRPCAPASCRRSRTASSRAPSAGGGR